MGADAQGHVYLIGDWWTIPGDVGTWRYKRKKGEDTYEQLKRSEFFGVADVP